MRATSRRVKLLVLPAVATVGLLGVVGCSTTSTPPAPAPSVSATTPSYDPASLRVRPVVAATPVVETECVDTPVGEDTAELTRCSVDKTMLYTLGPVIITGKAVTSVKVSAASPSASASSTASSSASSSASESAKTEAAPSATSSASGSASSSATGSAGVGGSVGEKAEKEPVKLTATLDKTAAELWNKETSVLATKAAPQNQVGVLVDGFLVEVLPITAPNTTGEFSFTVDVPEALAILKGEVDSTTKAPSASSSSTATPSAAETTGAPVAP